MTQLHATTEKTQEKKHKHPNIQYNQLSDTGLWVSEAGFGTYRTDDHNPDHKDSLKHALIHGINLIDTSSNYMNGRAEQLIGHTLIDLKKSHNISREEIVIVSKGGYIQGTNYEDSQDRKKQGTPYPELIELDHGLEHCIHPEFLEEQITKSLNRLQLDCIDIYLLHNPEYFLKWAQSHKSKSAKEDYYNRLAHAFNHLEKEVEMGRITYYGISSNTFPSPLSDPEFTQLDTLLSHIKEDARPHFKVIQLPFNLYEAGAATEENQDHGKTVLDVAKENNLAVLVNRPLNAYYNHQLFRLADTEMKGTITTEDLLYNQLADLEQEEEKAATLLTDNTPNNIRELLHISPIIHEIRSTITTITQWQEILNNYITPRLEACIHEVEKLNDHTLITWLEGFIRLIKDICEGIANLLKEEKIQENESLVNKIHHVIPEWNQCIKLNQLAIRSIRKTEGITSTLIGMRQMPYVNDVISELETNTDITLKKEQWNTLITALKN